MRIFGMGLPELLVILAVILLIFGPKNLPKLGSAIGKGVKSLREGIGGDKDDAKEEVVEEAVVEKVEQLESGAEAAEAAPKVKRVVKKKVVAE